MRHGTTTAQRSCTRRFGKLSPLLAASLVLALDACGGGASQSGSAAQAGPAVATLATEPAALPSFHLAPVVLDEPSSIDADGSGSSAFLPPHTRAVPDSLAGLDSSRLTPARIDEEIRRAASTGGARPQAG